MLNNNDWFFSTEQFHRLHRARTDRPYKPCFDKDGELVCRHTNLEAAKKDARQAIERDQAFGPLKLLFPFEPEETVEDAAFYYIESSGTAMDSHCDPLIAAYIRVVTDNLRRM